MEGKLPSRRGDTSHRNFLLHADNLSFRIDSDKGAIRIVEGISFTLNAGEILGLLGPNGCGKTSLLRILGGVVQPSDGAVLRGGGEVSLGMVSQHVHSNLLPWLTGVDNVALPRLVKGRNARRSRSEALDALHSMGLRHLADRYPHQLSGGMRQRVLLAGAMASDPELLLADEPTTALDVTIQAQVLELIKQLQRERGMAVLLITHDLGVVSGMADHVAVMYAGQIVEQAPREAFFEQPRHPYSRMLFSALPDSSKREARLAVIPGTVPALNQEFQGCRFAGRCDRGWAHCERAVPDWFETGSETGVRCHLADPQISAPGSRAEQAERATGQQVYVQDPAQRAELLQVDGLKVFFPIHKGFFKRVVGHVRAVDDVSIRIPRGQTLALVGESGCGKTTAGKAILQLLDATAGRVRFEDVELTALRGEALRSRRPTWR